MPITEEDFASIKTMIDSAVGEIGQTFITGQVIKRDAQRKLIWIKELGDQPIPVVDFNRMVDVYSFLATNEDWHIVGAAGEPAFQNGWVNFDADGSRPARFRKNALGTVFVEGIVKNGTVNVPIFTLPSGYRPRSFAADINAIIYPCVANSLYGMGLITSTGDLALTTGSNAWFSLHISFWADGVSSPPQVQKRSEISSIIVPAQGATVVVALERGTRRLPRCLGEIQSTEYIRAGDD
jgi:hypothetical protein